MPGAYALAIASNVTIALAFQPFKRQAMWEDIDGEQIEVQCAWLDKVSYAVQTHGISWQLLVLFCFFSPLRIGKGRRDQAQAPGQVFIVLPTQIMF